MNARRLAILAILFLLGVLFWTGVGRIEGVGEPWDGNRYWVLWYPLSLLLAAVAGALLGRHGWVAGAMLTGAQLPVMMLDSGAGTMLAAAVLLLAVLAIPPALVAALAGHLAVRRRAA